MVAKMNKPKRKDYPTTEQGEHDWMVKLHIYQGRKIRKLTEIAIYVRDNHLCGTPLLEAIDEVVSKDSIKTKITSHHIHNENNKI